MDKNMIKIVITVIGTILIIGILWYFYTIKTQEKNILPFTLTSSAFNNNQPIPQKYTCDGENISPSLAWENPPKDTMRLALVVDDPDAPKKPFIHWIMYNIPTDVQRLQEGAKAAFAHIANDLNHKSYDGPCPPKGDKAHRYQFKLYALQKVIQGEPKTFEEIMPNLETSLGVATLVGTYERK